MHIRNVIDRGETMNWEIATKTSNQLSAPLGTDMIEFAGIYCELQKTKINL
jgi:hypothetical protein